MLKEDYKDIEVEVYDADTMPDTLIGTVTLPWMELIENPSLWLINEMFKL